MSKKKKRNWESWEIDGSLDWSLFFWFAFEPQWVYAVLINSIAPLDLVTIEFRVRSLASSSAFMFAPKLDLVLLESNASAWNSYDIQLQYFNINSQRFNSRFGSLQSASRLFSVSLLLSVFLFPWKWSQTMQVLKGGGKGEIFDKRCLNAVCLSIQYCFFNNCCHKL